jgi:hypothetical protein
MFNKKILITGCPRSGTKYISKFLRRCGKDVPHETHVGEDGIASWFLTPTIPPNSSTRQFKNFKSIKSNNKTHSLRKPFHHNCPIPTAEFKSTFDISIHQIRDPRKCISSMSTLMRPSILWTKGFIDYPPQEEMSKSNYRIRQQMYFWYYWNKIGIENSQWHYCIERLGQKDVKERFCSDFEITESEFLNSYSRVSKKTNKRRPHLRSWEKLRRIDEEMYFKIIEFGEKLGYECK